MDINSHITLVDGFSLLILVVICCLFFSRRPKIGLKIIDQMKDIVLDFSQKQEDIPIISIELFNKRKFLIDRRIYTGIDLNFQCTVSSDPQEENFLPDESGDPLLTIKCNKRGIDPITFSIKAGKIDSKKTLQGTRTGDMFHILFHPEIIKENILEKYKDKDIKFDLKLEIIEICLHGSHEVEKKVGIVKDNCLIDDNFHLILNIPENAKREIKCEELQKLNCNALIFLEEEEKYIIPYSVSQPIKKLFKFSISNESLYKISPPVNGKISLMIYDVNEGFKPIKSNKIFYLHDSSSWDGQSAATQEQRILVNYDDKDQDVYFYVNFSEMGKNPRNPRDFRIKLKFERENEIPELEWDRILSVTPSQEKTEPIIQIFANDDSPLDVESTRKEDKRSLIVLRDFGKKFATQFEIPAFDMHPIKINENNITELFILRLGNRCNTGTGHYDWEISSPFLVENESVISKGTVVYVEDETTGKITDDAYSTEDVVFLLNPGNLEIRKFRFILEVKFTLTIQFFTEGERTVDELIKIVDITVKIRGQHDAAPNYLVIDFGTTSINIGHCDYNRKPGLPIIPETLKLESPANQMKSEDGLLPSIMSIKKGEKIGDANFIFLPANASGRTANPELLISEVKLMLIDGYEEIPCPMDFNFIDENGEHREGGYMKLTSLIESAYKNLKLNYISKHLKNYKRIIVTYPNSFNITHYETLLEIVTKVFEDEEKNIYKENIELVSESNAALFYYLMYRANQKKRPVQENIIICDIGGGTMDISQAEVKWKKAENYPDYIEVKKRDGIPFAGEKLDEAIALQVHRILEEYNKNIFTTQQKTKQNSVKVTGSDLLLDDSGDSVNQEESTTYNASAVKGNFYTNKIVWKKEQEGEEEIRDTNLLQILFAFKYTYILNFKKDMSKAKPGEKVKICLGANTTNEGLCFSNKNKHETSFDIKGHLIQSEIKNENGALYLYLNREDWLKLPYLERFKELFKNNFRLFIDSDKENIPHDASIILCGRASLWPSIPEALNELFPQKLLNNWLKQKEELDPDKKALALKRAVIDGALQKATSWSHLDFRDTAQTGVPAIYYESSPDIWEAKSLIPDKEGEPVLVDLNNSNFFHIGIMSAMGFSAYLGGRCFERKDYCEEGKKEKVMKLHLRKSKNKKNKTGFDFFVESDKNKRSFKKIHLNAPRSEKMPRVSHWPLEDVDTSDFK